jgi:hypothetical protein
MDPQRLCTKRLYREHCTYINGVFTKDMSRLGRPMKDLMILDNSPSAYMLQPECALPIISWYDDPRDRQLFDLVPLLTQLTQINDCREAITRFVRNNSIDIPFAKQVCRAIIDHQEQLLKQTQQESISSESPNKKVNLTEQPPVRNQQISRESK